MIRRLSGAGLGGAGKLAALSLAFVVALAMSFGVSARDHGHRYGHGGPYGGYYGGYHGGHHGHYGYARRGGHWSGGQWIAGAIVTGAVIGLVDNALRPAPVYYDSPVVYTRPRTVIYESAPVVRRRIVETRTVVYDDPYVTRYVRDDGYDDGDD